jgi:hypothetical protein
MKATTLNFAENYAKNAMLGFQISLTKPRIKYMKVATNTSNVIFHCIKKCCKIDSKPGVGPIKLVLYYIDFVHLVLATK